MKKFALGICAILVLLPACKSINETVVIDVHSIETLVSDEKPTTEQVEMVENDSFIFKNEIAGAFVPHSVDQLSALNSFYSGLAEFMSPSVIILVAPTSDGENINNIQTCPSCVFSTIYGETEVHSSLSSKLITDKIAVNASQSFAEETIAAFQTSFISEYFPETTVVPIVINDRIDLLEVRKLSRWLDENVPNDAFIIVNENFSTFQMKEVNQFHNNSAITSITNFDYENIFDLEIDNPSAVYAVMEFFGGRGFGKVFSPQEGFMIFEKSDNDEEEDAEKIKMMSLLSVGALPKDHNLGINSSWEYDPNYIERNDRTTFRLLREIKGAEDRFFRGVDYVVFDVPVMNDCIVEEQNDMKISFCKFYESEDLKDILKKINNHIEENESDLVYLLFEFVGGGELDENRKLLVRAITKEHVDIFVGRGIKEYSSPIYYKGSLIFYSLGDFVLDNKLANEFASSSSGMVIGLTATPENFEIYTFPINIQTGYPKIRDAAERSEMFKTYVQGADLPREAVFNYSLGTIKIAR